MLPNGLVILTERMPHVRSVAIGLWVKVGSRYERAEYAGVSHFIEHLLFKGTESRSAEDIARAIDSVGGTLDAFTSRENTCFYAKVLGEHLPLAVDLLSDLLLHPRLDAEDVEKERRVVLEEIKMVEDDPDDLIHDLFAQQVWRDHPLGRPILGSRQTLQAITRQAVVDQLRDFYQPDRVIVAAAGDLEHARVVELDPRRPRGLGRGAPSRPTAARLSAITPSTTRSGTRRSCTWSWAPRGCRTTTGTATPSSSRTPSWAAP